MRKFIDKLRATEELIEITHPVNPLLEMSEIADRMSKSPDGGKALLFTHTGTSFPVLMNAYGSPQRIAQLFGKKTLDEAAQEIETVCRAAFGGMKGLSLSEKIAIARRLFHAKPKKYRGWKRPPCQEVVKKDGGLSDLPILQTWTHDGGRFITLPIVITEDMDGKRNVGMYRMQVLDDRTTGMHWHKHKTGASHYRAYQEQGKKMPVAVVLGGDPLYSYVATAPLPEGIDEFFFAGFLRNRSVRMVPCLTQQLRVPADADFVIEGYVDPNEPLIEEGPFGDHTGFYTFVEKYPAFHITCITHRKKAIYPATVVGIPPMEDFYLQQATERILLPAIQYAMLPELVDMRLPAEGVAHNLVYVKIKNRYEGEVEKVASALWGAGQMSFNKVLVIFDEEVNIHDDHAVWQAISTQVRPSKDLFNSRGAIDVLDHAMTRMGYGGKIAVDSTRKWKSLPAQTRQRGIAFHHTRPTSFDPTPLAHVLLDTQVVTSCPKRILWWVLSQIDPVRDVTLENDQIIIDARLREKALQGKTYPAPTEMDKATQKRVDDKWNEWGLGQLMESPSKETGIEFDVDKHLLKIE